jgi:hypothetical protein
MVMFSAVGFCSARVSRSTSEGDGKKYLLSWWTIAAVPRVSVCEGLEDD